MIHQSALVIFRKVKRNKRPPLVSSTFMPHLRESKNTLKLSTTSLYPLLLIPLLLSTSYAQTPDTTPNVNSALKAESQTKDSTNKTVSQEPKDSKTLLSKIEIDLELDQKIDATSGQDRLKLVFDDFKRSAKYFVEEAKDYKDRQTQF